MLYIITTILYDVNTKTEAFSGWNDKFANRTRLFSDCKKNHVKYIKNFFIGRTFVFSHVDVCRFFAIFAYNFGQDIA